MRLPEETVNEFIATAFERHRIYILKELGVPKPWTASHVFGSYYFCNVFRRIDKTSAWIIENVIKPNERSLNLWKMIIMARYISRIDTLEDIAHEGGFHDLRRAQEVLRYRKLRDLPIVTNAFVVNSKTTDGYADKVTHLFRTIKFFQDNWPDMDRDLCGSVDLEHTYDLLITAPGCGPFMAYQYVCDMAYSSRYLLHAPDALEWAQLGLGAMRGMNRILKNENIKTKIPNALECVQELYYRWHSWCTPSVMRDEREKTCNLVPDHMQNAANWHFVDKAYQLFYETKLCDAQHWLCEYDKFKRGGSAKRRYDGGLNED